MHAVSNDIIRLIFYARITLETVDSINHQLYHHSPFNWQWTGNSADYPRVSPPAYRADVGRRGPPDQTRPPRIDMVSQSQTSRPRTLVSPDVFPRPDQPATNPGLSRRVPQTRPAGHGLLHTAD